jgi:hypothetical protein
MKYLPSIVIIEMEDVKREDSIDSDAEAFKKMTKYARVGREVQRIKNLNWKEAVKLPAIDDIVGKKKKGRFF